MKSVLLLVLFAGLVSARYHHHFDRRAETTTEEPESTESTTESEYTESTTESEGTTEEGFAAEAASDIGLPNCEEFEEMDEAALDEHCGEDEECLERAETCEFILTCIEYGQMSPDEIAAKCGEEEGCWKDVEECAMFGKIEDRVWRLERILRRLADRVRAISDLPLIQMMLKGRPPMQVPKGAGGPGALRITY